MGYTRLLLLLTTLCGATHLVNCANVSVPYSITKLWNGTLSDDPAANFTLFQARVLQDLTIEFQVPFFNNTKPDCALDEPCSGLWNYEVIEFFMADVQDECAEYIEMEFNPHGYYLILFHHGKRHALQKLPEVEYTATINEEEGTWSGSVTIPIEYLPGNLAFFNAYTIHKNEIGVTIYRALNEDTKYEEPDFHRIENFIQIDKQLLFPKVNSETWQNIAAITPCILIDKTLGKQDFNHLKGYAVLGGESLERIRLTVSAPYFNTSIAGEANDIPNPDDVETLRLYFANKEREILEILLHPDEKYKMIYWKKPYNKVDSTGVNSTINFTVNNKFSDRWYGEVQIDPQYILLNTTWYNAAMMYPGSQSSPEINVCEAYTSWTNSIALPDMYVIERYRGVGFLVGVNSE